MSDETPPEGWGTWPTERQVANTLDVSLPDLRRLAKRYSVSGYRAPDRTVRWSAQAVEDLERALERDRGHDQELLGSVRAANDHTERMFRLLEPAIQQTIADLRGQVREARERIRELERERERYLEARESALSEQAVRDVVLRESALGQERRESVMRLVRDRLPQLLDQLGGTLAGERGRALDTLARSLTPEQVEIFGALDDDIVSPQQKAALRALVSPEHNKGNSHDTPPKP